MRTSKKSFGLLSECALYPATHSKTLPSRVRDTSLKFAEFGKLNAPQWLSIAEAQMEEPEIRSESHIVLYIHSNLVQIFQDKS